MLGACAIFKFQHNVTWFKQEWTKLVLILKLKITVWLLNHQDLSRFSFRRSWQYIIIIMHIPVHPTDFGGYDQMIILNMCDPLIDIHELFHNQRNCSIVLYAWHHNATTMAYVTSQWGTHWVPLTTRKQLCWCQQFLIIDMTQTG